MSTIQGGAYPVYAWRVAMPATEITLIIDGSPVGTEEVPAATLWGYGPTAGDAVHGPDRVIGYLADLIEGKYAEVDEAFGRVRVGQAAATTAGHPRPSIQLTLASSATSVAIEWADPAVGRMYGLVVDESDRTQFQGFLTGWLSLGAINGAGYWAPSSIVYREEQDTSYARETRATPFTTPSEDGDGIDHVYYGEARSTELEHDFVEAANVFRFRAANELFAQRAGRSVLDRQNLLEHLLEAGARGETVRIYRGAGTAYEPSRIVAEAARSVQGIAQRTSGTGVRYRCLVPLRVLEES